MDSFTCDPYVVHKRSCIVTRFDASGPLTSSRDDGISPPDHLFVVGPPLHQLHLDARPPAQEDNNDPLKDAFGPSSDRAAPVRLLLQAPHDVLHVAGVDVVSLQQAAVAGALQGELRTQGDPGSV